MGNNSDIRGDNSDPYCIKIVVLCNNSLNKTKTQTTSVSHHCMLMNLKYAPDLQALHKKSSQKQFLKFFIIKCKLNL